MSFKKIQEDVERWVNQYKIKYFPPLSIGLEIASEVGELARELENRYGPRVKKSEDDVADIEDEIGDILFNLTCLANSHNIDLDLVWEKKMNKQYGRDKDRYEKVLKDKK